jgi:KaiC/GvpD/RAD55 family RecA-like ATPase
MNKPRQPDVADAAAAAGPAGFAASLDAAATTGAPAGPPPWKTPAERALLIGYAGPRLATSLPTLNRATRGGIPPTGKVIVIGGAPGAGKTSLACQEAFAWACTGICVTMLCADEDADGILTRIGQSLGIPRDLLERADDAARVELAEHMRAAPTFELVDAEEEEGATLELVAERLAARRQGTEPAVLVIDSLQTVAAEAASKARDSREQINLTLKTIKKLAKRFRLTVIATSELGRAAYRETQAKNKEVNLLSAFKESGAIEYGVTLAIVLRGLDEGEATIEAVIVKNRLGGPRDKPSIELKMDADRAQLVEVPSPSEAEREAAEMRKQVAMQNIVVQVIGKARATSPLHNVKEIYQRCRAYKSTPRIMASFPKWVEAVEQLWVDGAIVKKNKKGEIVDLKSKGATYHLADTVTVTGDAPSNTGTDAPR